jgi:hypothetical protein
LLLITKIVQPEPSIISDSFGDIYVAYTTTGNVSGGSFTGGIYDIIVFKLDTNGNTLWTRQNNTFNTSLSDVSPSITSDLLGNVYVAYHADGIVSGHSNMGSTDIVVFKIGPSYPIIKALDTYSNISYKYGLPTNSYNTQLVTTDATQTLTNKNISTGSIINTNQPIATTVTSGASYTATGDIKEDTFTLVTKPNHLIYKGNSSSVYCVANTPTNVTALFHTLVSTSGASYNAGGTISQSHKKVYTCSQLICDGKHLLVGHENSHFMVLPLL